MVHRREKGARGEREVAAILVAHGYLGGKRGQQRSGLEQADVVEGPPGWWFEVKRTERPSLWEFWAQATRDAEKASATPVVVTRRNNAPWLAVLEFETFLGLLTRIEDLEAQLAAKGAP